MDWDSHIVASLMQPGRDKAHSIDENRAAVGHDYGREILMGLLADTWV